MRACILNVIIRKSHFITQKLITAQPVTLAAASLVSRVIRMPACTRASPRTASDHSPSLPQELVSRSLLFDAAPANFVPSYAVAKGLRREERGGRWRG